MLLGISSNDATSGSSHDFHYQLGNFINLRIDSDGNTSPQIMLKRIRMWNSWNNISAALANNIIRYSNGVINQNITIPDGNYTLSDLFTYISAQITANGDDPANLALSYSRNTGKITVTIANSYGLDLSYAGSPTVIFGHSANITSTTTCSNKADVLNGLDTVQVHSNIHKWSIFKNRQSDVLATFVPSYPPNSYMDIQFNDSPPLNMNTFDLSNLYFRLTDQNEMEFNLNGSPVYYEFYVV